MRRSARLHPTVLAVVLATVAAGCGLLGRPSVSSDEEVLDALERLRAGAEIRVTAEVTVDEDEVRRALRDDPEAQELLRDAMEDEGADVDTLLADLEEAQELLADHALLLASGADGSARVAAEFRGTPWVDLRVGGDQEAGEDGTVDVDLQLQVDWETVGTVLEQPDLRTQLDAASEEVGALLGQAPELQAVGDLVVAFLAGELVGISGEVGPDMLDGLGMGELGGTSAEGGPLGLRGDDLDPRAMAAEAFEFDNFRTDGDATLVDVTFELRAVAEAFLDRLGEAPDQLGMGFADVEEARAELDQLPERLTDVAVLRFDGDGVLQQVRIDVLDALLQAATAATPDDEDVATVERLSAELDATGIFVVMDVTGVGDTASVLGDATTTASPEDLATAFGTLFLGALGGGLEDVDDLGGLDDMPLGDDGASGWEEFSTFGSGDVAVGDCFDDDALFGLLPADADPIVDCAGPHDNEAFATVEVDVDGYESYLYEQPDLDACEARFVEVAGGGGASDLVVASLPPSPADFADGSRTSVCYVYDIRPLTGSVFGADG